MPRDRDPYRDPVWVLLPGTVRYPAEYAHRVDPFAADVTVCGRSTTVGQVCADVAGLRQCHRCNQRVGRRRLALRAQARRRDELARRQPARDTSVRTVSGGLPGLGRRS